MKPRLKLASIAAAAALTLTVGAVAFAGSASAWHGALTSSVECKTHDTVATFDLTEPGESWNSAHADMVVNVSDSSLFKVGTHVPFGATYEPNPEIITAPVAVHLTLGWVGSQETSTVSTTASPVDGCETTTEAPTTTTTEAPTTTTTAAPTTTTTAPATTTTTAPATTTTVNIPPVTIVIVPPTTAPPATVATPVVGTPAFTG